MSTEKQRLFLFLVLSILSMIGMQALMLRLGWIKPAPPPERVAPAVAGQPRPPAPVAADKDKDKDKDAAKVREKEAPPAAVAAKPDGAKAEEAKAAIKLWEPGNLVLGSLAKATPYHLRLRIDQKGGGVAEIHSSRFEAELTEDRPRDRAQPLPLIKRDTEAPPSFALSLVAPEAKDAAAVPAEWLRLDRQVWEVVPDARGRAVRPVEHGQEIVLRAEVGTPPVVVTRAYRLREGRDDFELTLSFESPERARRLAYTLVGPHGVPIEGEWYTGTFRDVFVGQLKAGGGVAIDTKTAYDVVKNQESPERYQSLPLAFAGVENQYFAVFLQPDPLPASPEARPDRETVPVVVHEDPVDRQKSDVTVEVTSKPLDVGPNLAATHRWRVYAGPKTPEALPPAAADLASFHKGWQIPILGPLGAAVGKSLIAPALGYIYDFTAYVARLFGGRRGSYGIAIVLLVICVRLMLFPLSRKQAIMAKKMQEIQPLLAELKEKYKDDKERQMREMMALQRKHGVNMFAGCLPALFQIPIFIGLWQALNNSVALRHAPFLWVESLSAPDMLFKFPFPIPLIGQWLGPYFNLLPLVAVTLSLVQTKLFSPPAVTEEAKMQQSMIKYMMILMVFMFYKVPAGLVLYIITSSTWSIAERLLLPKTLGKRATIAADDDEGPGPGKGGGGKGGPDDGRGPAGPAPAGNGQGGWLQRKLEKLLEEASKDATIRREPEPERGRDRDRDRNPPRQRPRTPPGRRR